MVLRKILMVAPVVLSHLVFAQDVTHEFNEVKKHIHGVHKECPLPKNTEDIIKCALGFHPRMKRGELIVDSLTKLEEKASQIPNPTLSTRFVKGANNGRDTSELETNLSFTLELGGKRSLRTEYAAAKKTQAIILNDATKADVKITTVLNMHRLRQLLEEKKLLSEAVIAFSKVIGQLRNLPRLSAQQEASLTLFEMALEETKIDESELYEELRILEHYFHVATGHSIREINDFLPEAPSVWPRVIKTEQKRNSPEVNKMKSLLALASTEYKIQKSQVWPDLKIGPSLVIEKDGIAENRMIGLNLQLLIPVFHANSGGKTYANSELLRAKKNVSLTIAEESHERFEQQRIYESSVKILNKTMKKNLVEKKHNRIEKLYLRGVVSSSVFLDSLKQKLSYLRSRNNRELRALKALWNIYKYDGKIFEVKI